MRILLASDLHLSTDLAAERAHAGPELPPDTYDHAVDGQLVWHNTMLVEQMARMLDALAGLIRREQPDLVVLLGDLVNTNWAPNVSAVAAGVAALPAEVRVVTGNHDIYLEQPGTRLQDALAPGEYATGCRHAFYGDLGLIFLDLFVHHTVNGKGVAVKATDPQDRTARADYRAEDIAAALALLDAYPARPFLVFGHFPMTAPEARLAAPGRKIGWRWPTGAPLAARLDHTGNLLGIICGHQHFCHLQRFAHGFHWTLPALVEYPCAAALLEISGPAGAMVCSGQIVTPLQDLAAASLAYAGEAWTAGEDDDRAFTWRQSTPT